MPPARAAIGGILGPYFGGWLLGWFGGDSAALFVAVTVATAIGAVAVVFLRPDAEARADVPAKEASALT